MRSPIESLLESRLIGKAHEHEIFVDDCASKALVDTGSMISTLSENFYREMTNKPTLRSLEDFGIDMYCANGQKYLTLDI